MAKLAGISLLVWKEPGARDLASEIGIDATEEGDDLDVAPLVLRLNRLDPEIYKDPLQHGCRPTFFQGIVQAYRAPSRDTTLTLLSDTTSLFFVDEYRGHIDGFVADHDAVPGSSRAALEIALALVLRWRGRFHLHAGAIVLPEGESILLVGGSGAGKTTATLALVEAGSLFLGDDALVLANTDDGPRIWSFPRLFHVGPETLDAFPRLRLLSRETHGYGDKRAIDPTLAFPSRATASCGAPTRILHPRIEQAENTMLTPLSKAEGLGNLIAQSASLLIEGGPNKDEHLSLLSRIANDAEHIDLRLGRDLLHDPALLKRALEQA